MVKVCWVSDVVISLLNMATCMYLMYDKVPVRYGTQKTTVHKRELSERISMLSNKHKTLSSARDASIHAQSAH